MVVKMGKFRFFPPVGGIPYWDFDYFCIRYRRTYVRPNINL